MSTAAPPTAAARDDARLTEARAGCERAFAAIVRDHQGMVFGLAYHFLQRRGEAEELAQDVFLTLHQNLHRIASAQHLVFWLRRVTSNRCIDAVRSLRHRTERPIEAFHDPGGGPGVGDPLLGELLRGLVAELPPHPRLVVTLRFQEDLDLSEIAAITDMPLNTVKSHLRRSMDVLRRKLALQGYVYAP